MCRRLASGAMAVITDLSADLLSDIFYTVLRSSPREGLQTLAALARTCSAFFDSAANILWRSVPSLTLLAFLLPQDAWCISGEEKERRSKHAVIVRAIADQVPPSAHLPL